MKSILRSSSKFLLDIHPEVRAALHERRSIVACETAILTHGLPRPVNVETCAQIERIIREHGSIPATIAVLHGRIKVGLTAEELEYLGSNDQIFKASRRDLPYLIAQRASAGTTVAATMLIAHRAGIPIFATGGIGGVHRDSSTTGDISSDLDELGRTPVCVVSSGVKSILDIPKTLEYLETKGVGVYTFGETDVFPNFFTQSNEFGSRSCAAIRTIDEATELVRAMVDLNLDSGLLLAVPIEKKDELQGDTGEHIESIIRRALDEATKQGISGNRVTPFVLGEIRRQTANRSIKTNQNLIYKNARIASQIAARLASSLVLIGARNVDIHIQLDGELKLHQGSTVPCRVRQNFGGVAFNVSHALHLLNNPSVRLLTVSGEENTASYVSLLDAKTNELICGFGDMSIYEQQFTPAFFEKHRTTLINASWLMFDANLGFEAMKYLVDFGRDQAKQLAFISAGGPLKARRIQPFLADVHVLFCNRLEFEAISDTSATEANLRSLMAKHPKLKFISITLGADGVLIGTKGQVTQYSALKVDEGLAVRNVTGAGDSFAAGVMHHLLNFGFEKIERAVATGLLAAKLTLTSANTISEQLKTIDEKSIDQICAAQLHRSSDDF